MGIFDRYGPNSGQVKRFIERVGTLSEEERKSTELEEALTRSAFGERNNYYVQVAAMSAYGNDHEEKLLGAAGKKLREAASSDSRFYFRAQTAMMAVALCKDVMDPGEYAAWYGPFARLIPVKS